jgi:hypothetical protein
MPPCSLIMLKYDEAACWTSEKLIGPDRGKMAPTLIVLALMPVETPPPGLGAGTGAPGTAAL